MGNSSTTVTLRMHHSEVTVTEGRQGKADHAGVPGGTLETLHTRALLLLTSCPLRGVEGPGQVTGTAVAAHDTPCATSPSSQRQEGPVSPF